MHRRSGQARRAGVSVNNETGSLLLLWALGLNMVLLLAVGSYLSFFQTVLNTTTRPYLQDQAVALADAGVQAGLWELNHNNGLFAAGWTNISGTQPCIDVGGAGAQCYQRGPLGLTAADGSNITAGTYTVTVANPASPTPVLRAQGSVTTTSLSQAVRATMQISPERFRYALFGNSLSVIPAIETAITVDSYDSTVGAYSFDRPNSAGDVGANQVLYLNAGYYGVVKGNAYKTSTTSVTITRASNLAGTQITQAAQTFPSIVMPGTLSSAPNSGTLYLSGSSVATCSGPMHYDMIVVSQNARLIMDAGCQLYVEGIYDYAFWVGGGMTTRTPTPTGINITGSGTIEARGNNQIYMKYGMFSTTSANGFVTTTSKPKDLQIYAAGAPPSGTSTPTALLAQHQWFVGTVYVQQGDITFRNYLGTTYDRYNDVAGSLIAGGTVNVRVSSGSAATGWPAGLRVHYDESLATSLALNGTGRPSRRVTSWQTQ